jgi:hypothetical protein
MAITALPTPPSRQDPTNFNDRADAFLGALPQFQTEANALQTNVNTSEVNAVASAAAVLAATNIVKWVSGTTYANGAVVWSPINGLAYRRITTAGSGTTDPSADTTNYKQVNGTGDVSTSGNQTIAGTKTFSSTITGDITGNAGTVTNGVYITGNQTIAGTKIFSSTITGTITNATLAAKASTVSSGGGDGTAIQFTWSGFGGQPTWLFGGDTPGNVNVYNPANFNVNYANSSGTVNVSVAAGNSYVASTGNAGTGYVSNSVYYKIGGRIVTLGNGAIRVKVVVNVANDAGYGTCLGYYKVYKNGSAVTGDITANTQVTWTGDFVCANGDYFEVYGRPQYSGYAVSGYIALGAGSYPSISPAVAYSG